MEIIRKHFIEITSTNDFAKELIADYDKLIVTADFQTAGKGRNNKHWLGDFNRNVYYTYAINHKFIKPLKNSSYYQIIGCLAVYNTLNGLLSNSKTNKILRIKYPNDVYIFVNDENINIYENKNKDINQNYKKISGILSEHSYLGGELNSTVLGIGVNVNQTKFDESLNNNATSLIKLGYNFDVETVINLLTTNLEQLFSLDEEIIFHSWVNHLNLESKHIQIVNKEGIYKLNKINLDCRLELINLENNQIEIIDNGDSIRYDLS